MSAQTKSIYIICTGGTISMCRTEQGYAPALGFLAKAMEQIPELKNPDMPSYTVHEYENPIDSANMTPAIWLQIGNDILKNYDQYDGFVILHGTDTLAYTASALAFMFENLSKPIILTGSQLPLFETRSDARENLINAIVFASHYRIPEVCVYFHNKLFRGNRCKKMDASSFGSFASPNFPILGKVGMEISVRQHLIHPIPQARVKLQELGQLSVGVLRIFPGISLEVLKHFLRPPMQALVLETYGTGTAPEDPAFLAIIKQGVEAGMIIVNCSQCPIAKVKMSRYAAGTTLMNVGVISGGDMTVEAAVAKLFYLFSKKLEPNEIKHEMSKDLRGELTI